MLTVNNVLLSDAYVYARKNLDIKNIDTSYPVLSVSKEDDKMLFEALYNSFIYLWDHPSTMLCEDVTHYNTLTRKGLPNIRLPHDIQFEQKAVLQKKHTPISDEDCKSWQYQLKEYVQDTTRKIKKSNSSENIFIACSWEVNEKSNKFACKLEDYLTKDFKTGLNIQMVKPDYGTPVFEKIYANLQNATLGIVILTKDIEGKDGKFYSKPNIYHELGFLMGQFHYKKVSKVLIVKEIGVESPSNVHSYELIKFEKNTFGFQYALILEWLKKNCATITEEQIKNAKTNHKRRMNNKSQKDLEKLSVKTKPAIAESVFGAARRYMADGKFDACINELERLLTLKFKDRKADYEDLLTIQQSTLSILKDHALKNTMDIEIIMRKRNEVNSVLLNIMRELEQPQ
jgi:hypothetical protein